MKTSLKTKEPCDRLNIWSYWQQVNNNTLICKYSALLVRKLTYSFCHDLRKRKDKEEIIYANSVKQIKKKIP